MNSLPFFRPINTPPGSKVSGESIATLLNLAAPPLRLAKLLMFDRKICSPTSTRIAVTKLFTNSTKPNVPRPKIPILTQLLVDQITAKSDRVTWNHVTWSFATLRKENRKPPPTMLPTLKEKSATLPSSGAKNGKFYGVVRSIGDSKLVNSVKNRIGGLMNRKSYANVEELKGLDSVARTAINGENRVGRTNRVSGRTLLGYRQL
ncbi:hypothetical protein BC332_05507 [Capsicum chinense]|nr:hypothetical protein BC332_05507 [Capsicum chinense]